MVARALLLAESGVPMHILSNMLMNDATRKYHVPAALAEKKTESNEIVPKFPNGRAMRSRRILVIQPRIEQTGGGPVAQQCIIDGLRALGNETYTLSFFGDRPLTYAEQHFSYSPSSVTRSRTRKYSYERRLAGFIREVINKTRPEIIFVGQIW